MSNALTKIALSLSIASVIGVGLIGYKLYLNQNNNVNYKNQILSLANAEEEEAVSTRQPINNKMLPPNIVKLDGATKKQEIQNIKSPGSLDVESIKQQLKIKLISATGDTSISDDDIQLKPYDTGLILVVFRKKAFLVNRQLTLLIPSSSVIKLDDALKRLNTTQAQASINGNTDNAKAQLFPENYQKLKELSVIYPATGKQVGEFVVFFDYTCAVCREFYPKIEKLQAAGYTVHLALFPRDGIGSLPHLNMLKAYCSSDQQKQVNSLVINKSTFADNSSCKDPMVTTKQLGDSMKIPGTPYFLLPDGTFGSQTILKEYMGKASGSQEADKVESHTSEKKINDFLNVKPLSAQ